MEGVYKLPGLITVSQNEQCVNDTRSCKRRYSWGNVLKRNLRNFDFDSGPADMTISVHAVVRSDKLELVLSASRIIRRSAASRIFPSSFVIFASPMTGIHWPLRPSNSEHCMLISGQTPDFSFKFLGSWINKKFWNKRKQTAGLSRPLNPAWKDLTREYFCHLFCIHTVVLQYFHKWRVRYSIYRAVNPDVKFNFSNLESHQVIKSP